MCITPQTQSPWAHVTASSRHAPWADTLWRAGVSPYLAQRSPHLLTICIQRCHLGRSIVYDTVSNLSWSVDIRTHGIVNVIENLLSQPWPPSEEIGREVPEPVVEDDCVVCVLLGLMRRDSASYHLMGGRSVSVGISVTIPRSSPPPSPPTLRRTRSLHNCSRRVVTICIPNFRDISCSIRGRRCAHCCSP